MLKSDRPHRRLPAAWALGGLWGLLVLVVSVVPALALAAPTPPEVMITPLRDDGGRVDWSASLNVIAFDALGADDYYDVYAMTPDGAIEVCLTCDSAVLPNKHIGNPAWHPSGRYLAIQVEKAEHASNSEVATPGIGINNDIWLMGRGGGMFYRITNVPEGMGVLHPHFSPDGSKLVWAERISDGVSTSGEWVLRVLDFSDGIESLRTPSISTFQPFGGMLYESHGFTPDSKEIVFTAYDLPDEPSLSWFDIFTLELETSATTRLTQTAKAWDEHAHYSPDGERVLWASSMYCNCNPFLVDDLHTDYWLMNPLQPATPMRLTYFSKPGHPHYNSERLVAADSSWSPTGYSFVAYIQIGEPSRPYEGYIARIDFVQPGAHPSPSDE